jgi:hypothetical protein
MLLWELRDGAYIKAFSSSGSAFLDPDLLQVVPLGFPDLPPPVKFHITFHEFTVDLRQELVVLVEVDRNRSVQSLSVVSSTNYY